MMRRTGLTQFFVTAVALLALSVVSSPAAWAQAVYGSIGGSVVDQSGAPVPAAAVTIRSLERQTEDTVTTNASGNYRKDRLVPGTYSMRA